MRVEGILLNGARLMYIRNLKDAEPFMCAGIQFGMVLPRDLTNSVEVVWSRFGGSTYPADRHTTFDQLFFVLKGAGGDDDRKRDLNRRTADARVHSRNTEHRIRPTTPEGLEYLYFIVWGQGVPEAEQGWKRAYSQIHDRRTAE